MNCDDWRLFLQDYLDGVLSEAPKGAIDRHLSECGACLAEARAHQEVRKGLSEQPLLEPPPGLADRVLARIDRPSAGWKREFARLAAAAALLVGIGLGASAVVPRGKIDQAQSTVQSNFRAQERLLDSWFHRAGVRP